MMQQVNLEQLMKRVASGVLLTMVGVSGSALAADTPVATAAQLCGKTFGPGGSVTFLDDIDCAPKFDPAVTFVGPINVKMEGKALKCKGKKKRADIGILLKGKQVKLHDGSVKKCGNNRDLDGAGVVADGDGGHRIERMDVRRSRKDGVRLNSDGNIVKRTNSSYHKQGSGFVAYSNQNDLANNTAYYNRDDGMVILGHQNKLTNNDTSYNGIDGIGIGGNGLNIGPIASNQNKVVNNTATYNGLDGIFVVEGDDNRISNNTASDNGFHGIHVQHEATNTRVKSNTAEDNGLFDLLDDNLNCDPN